MFGIPGISHMDSMLKRHAIIYESTYPGIGVGRNVSGPKLGPMVEVATASMIKDTVFVIQSRHLELRHSAYARCYDQHNMLHIFNCNI
jgi:hypothetical protein